MPVALLPAIRDKLPQGYPTEWDVGTTGPHMRHDPSFAVRISRAASSWLQALPEQQAVTSTALLPSSTLDSIRAMPRFSAFMREDRQIPRQTHPQQCYQRT